jgi:hypothetical protein
MEALVLAFLRIAIALAIFSAVAIAQAEASDMLALTGVAHAYGFTYATESTQAAVELSRPGLSLLIRAGDPRYQVNDDVRYLGRTPVFRNNQMYVDRSFERILADLAAAHPWPTSGLPMVITLPVDAPAAVPALTVKAKYVEGSDGIDISGSGPPGYPVSVVLKARMSRDIPIVTIGRTIVIADNDGHFHAVIAAGSIDLQNTTFFATASGRGLEPVSTHIEIQKPNPDFHTPNDGLPKG